jgi:hypothetical protein
MDGTAREVNRTLLGPEGDALDLGERGLYRPSVKNSLSDPFDSLVHILLARDAEGCADIRRLPPIWKEDCARKRQHAPFDRLFANNEFRITFLGAVQE